MSKYEPEFGGRRVVIDLDDTGLGWSWTFLIQDGAFGQSANGLCLTETVALREAESRARLEIDSAR